jgi:hypothetical protein
MDAAQPATLDALIDEFVREHRYLPDEAVAVLESEELPLRLQARIRSIPADASWRAWSDGFRLWLIVARRVCEPRLGVRGIAVEMSFHAHDGDCAATAVWARRADGKWRLYRVPADSSDDDSCRSAPCVPEPSEETSPCHH